MAREELEAIVEELQSWRDNIPESLSGGQKAEQLDESINTIESIEIPEPNDVIGELRTSYIELHHPKKISRPKRLLNVASALNACTGLECEDDEYEGFCDDIEEAVGEVENVELPGMF
jgi:hypothetical protein